MGPDDLVASAAYQPEPTAAAAARRFVRDTLQEWMVPAAAGPGLVDDAVLLTSELVTNAVVHAATQVQVTCRLADGAVEVVVRDGHPARLVPEATESEAGPAERTGGRGLLMPAALASAWGVAYGRSSKAVWFRLGLAGPRAGLAGGTGDEEDAAGELADAIGVTAALATALRSPGGRPSRGQVAEAGPVPVAAEADSGYQQLLSAAVESARVAVGADAAFAMMADEDGDLRLRAAVGSIPAADGEFLGSPPSVATVPFVVDGRVTGLLAAASMTAGSFGDPETARLQWLADRSGPALQRAWLAELERIRRDRIRALAETCGLLTGGLGREDIMALVGQATVPRLAPWCAVLTLPESKPTGRPGPRTGYARHTDDRLTGALAWLLDRVCQVAAPDFAEGSGAAPDSGAAAGRGAALGRSAAPRPGRRLPLVVGDMKGAPAGAGELIGSTAWCFPLGVPRDAAGVFVIGDGGADRLPREVAALAADMACRAGLALDSARLVAHKG